MQAEILCVAGYKKVWLPCVDHPKGWDLKTTGKWKLSDNGEMYFEAERYWPKDLFDKLFNYDSSMIEWYSEKEIRFFE